MRNKICKKNKNKNKSQKKSLVTMIQLKIAQKHWITKMITLKHYGGVHKRLKKLKNMGIHKQVMSLVFMPNTLHLCE